MSAVLEHVDETRRERFENNLQELAERHPSKDTYESFMDSTRSTVSQVDEIITSLQDERQELLREKDRLKQQIGKAALRSLREDERVEPVELGETGTEGELVAINRKLEDWQTYRAAVFRIAMSKLLTLVKELAAKDIDAKVYERSDELLSKQHEFFREQTQMQISDVREDVRKLEDSVAASLERVAAAVEVVAESAGASASAPSTRPRSSETEPSAGETQVDTQSGVRFSLKGVTGEELFDRLEQIEAAGPWENMQGVLRQIDVSDTAFRKKLDQYAAERGRELELVED